MNQALTKLLFMNNLPQLFYNELGDGLYFHVKRKYSDSLLMQAGDFKIQKYV